MRMSIERMDMGGGERQYKRGAPRMLSPKPECPVHHVPMFVGSSAEYVRYCYCPVLGCTESEKMSRRAE